jgi:pimeloyl-ACP methyl ester carboxylesterase
MGGQIALEMYEQETIKKDEKCECGHDHNHKNKILSLTLISTTPKFVGTDDFKVGMNKAVFHKFRKGIEKDTDKAMDDFYTLIFPKGGDNKKLINELKTQNSGSMVLDLCMDGFEKADERRILSKVSVPTLILTGDNDEIIDPKASMYLSQEIKGSKLKICKGAGHAPFLTKEKEVIDELRTFLG